LNEETIGQIASAIARIQDEARLSA